MADAAHPNRRRLSTDPEPRMGVYKSLDDVPPWHRLNGHADAYAGRDVWAEFSEREFARYDSDRFRENHERAGRDWREFMADRGRHHALATPEDAEAWSASLLKRFDPTHAYNSRWVRVEAFYSWLESHTDHPHTYNPLRMAAADGGAAGELWAVKVGQNDKREHDREVAR